MTEYQDRFRHPDVHFEQHPELQYLRLISDLISFGDRRETRNGSVVSLFGRVMYFNLEKYFPLLTTKKMFFKGILSELAWFLRGSTDVTELHQDDNHIWDANTSERDFDAGPVYGFQWRHFGAEYTDCKGQYEGIDQVASLIDNIKKNPHSRRLILSAHNPKDEPKMCLPPCHMTYQFYVREGRLHCQMYQRSADVFLGLPFNIASTALLTHLLAHETSLLPGSIRIVLGDCHIYESHMAVAAEQLRRVPYTFPTIKIERESDGLKNVTVNDIVLENYRHHSKLYAKMVI